MTALLNFLSSANYAVVQMARNNGVLPAGDPMRDSAIEVVMAKASISNAHDMPLTIHDAFRVAGDISGNPLRLPHGIRDRSEKDIFVFIGDASVGENKTPLALIGSEEMLFVVQRAFLPSSLPIPGMHIRVEMVGDSDLSDRTPLIDYVYNCRHASVFVSLESLGESEARRLMDNAAIVFNGNALEETIHRFRKYDALADFYLNSPSSDDSYVWSLLKGAANYAMLCRRMDPATQARLARKYVRAAEREIEHRAKMKAIGALGAFRDTIFKMQDLRGIQSGGDVQGSKELDGFLNEAEVRHPGLWMQISGLMAIGLNAPTSPPEEGRERSFDADVAIRSLLAEAHVVGVVRDILELPRAVSLEVSDLSLRSDSIAPLSQIDPLTLVAPMGPDFITGSPQVVVTHRESFARVQHLDRLDYAHGFLRVFDHLMELSKSDRGDDPQVVIEPPDENYPRGLVKRLFGDTGDYQYVSVAPEESSAKDHLVFAVRSKGGVHATQEVQIFENVPPRHLRAGFRFSSPGKDKLVAAFKDRRKGSDPTDEDLARFLFDQVKSDLVAAGLATSDQLEAFSQSRERTAVSVASQMEARAREEELAQPAIHVLVTPDEVEVYVINPDGSKPLPLPNLAEITS